jgi:hypothetical protein
MFHFTTETLYIKQEKYEVGYHPNEGMVTENIVN